MSNFTALVPFKYPGEGKSRLAQVLNCEERARLRLAMLDHLVTVLQRLPEITKIVLIAEVCPEGWQGEWQQDLGRGLNGELDAAMSKSTRPVLIIHADLPLVDASDIRALLAVARENGVAIAPDRHGMGTNAVAINDARDFPFHFGPGSCALHLQMVGRASRVERDGLACDCDTPADLARALDAAPTLLS